MSAPEPVDVLLTGAFGLVGSALRATAPASVRLIPLSHRDLDIRDEIAVRAALETHRPAWLVNAAAYTAVDRAEHEVEQAHLLNEQGPEILARACRARDIGILHFGSDYIFDGASTRPYREDDPPRPLSAYGRSKLAGELAVRESGARHLIVRTQWIYGAGTPSFPGKMWQRASAGQPTRVVSDQQGRPTSAQDLASACWRLLGSEGVVHVANEGVATWYDVAHMIFDAFGRLELLSPCMSDELLLPAPRPRYSVLDTGRARQLLGGALPDWRTSMRAFMATLAVPHP